MRKEEKKKDEDSGKWLFGLAGIALGAVGAYVATQVFGEKSEKISEQQNSQITNQNNNNLTTFSGENEHLLCPISQSLMTDPVTIKQCGHTFQRDNIQQWLQRQEFCPLCKKHANVMDLVQNYTVKNLVEDAIKSGQIKN